MLPATKAQPKEMLPLFDKPIIQYAVEEAVAAGVEQVIIVTAAGKRAVEDHFDRSFELERYLEGRGDADRLQAVRRVSELAEIAYIRQKEQRGVGHAVLTARNLVGDEPFLLFLPDDVIVAAVPAARQLIDVFERQGGSVIAVMEVDESEISNYGVVGGEAIADGLWRVRELVEKPPAASAPSNLAIVGRYVLTPGIFEEIARTDPGAGGEIQLTDAMAGVATREPLYAVRFQGRRFDTGRPLGYLQASIEMALSRPEIAEGLRRYLRRLVENPVASSGYFKDD
jgi:UTP--glucose-1-phosphate uridylyltransferase